GAKGELLGRDADDAIARAVARGHVHRAVGTLDDRPQTAVLLVIEDLLLHDGRAGDGEAPQILFLQRRDEQRPRPRAPAVTGDERRPARRVRDAARRPGRIGEALAHPSDTLLVRPAVV